MFWFSLFVVGGAAAIPCNYVYIPSESFIPVGYCAVESNDATDGFGLISYRFRCVDNVPENAVIDLYRSSLCTGQPFCTTVANLSEIIKPGAYINCDHGMSHKLFLFYFFNCDMCT